MRKHFLPFAGLLVVVAFCGPLVRLDAAEPGASALLETVIRDAAADKNFTAADIPAVKAFYELRHFEPAWRMQESSTRETVKDFISYMRSILHAHGMNERNYAFGQLQSKADANTPEALAEADIIATSIVLRLAGALAGSDPVPQSKMHTWPIQREKIDMPVALNQAVNTRKVSEFLDSLVPATPKYKRLMQVLSHYRDMFDRGGWQSIPAGSTLRHGDTDARVPLLLKRLAAEGYIAYDPAAAPSNLYEESLQNAMKDFQITHGLNGDGVIGPETIRALNVPITERIDQIRVNMARIRHSPMDAWEDIVINIPSARLSFFQNGQQVYEAPVVVGRIDRPTPLVSSEIYEMIINPFWYVPRSIAEKDILPKLKKNPNYLEKVGISLRDGGDIEDGSDIAGRLRQRPGPGNSLGRLKFNFQNRHSVYLHGTPHTEDFVRDNRNQSSGCVRLEKPDELAMIFLRDDASWDEEKLQKKIDSVKTITVPAPKKTPVKLLYWTVAADDKGNVHFYNDVYGLDREWQKYL